jgi:hypothetical protein
MNKERKVIKIPVPKEIWDAEMSICNLFAGKDIFGAWMRSIQDIVNQYTTENKIKSL